MMKKTFRIGLVFALALTLVLAFAGCGGGKEVPVTGVQLNQTAVKLVTGETVKLSATVTPADAADLTAAWSTNHMSVAKVSDAGLVTAVAPGSAKITVKTTDGNFEATCDVIVVAKSVTSLAVTRLPDKTRYITGELFDGTGIVVTGSFNDGSTAEVTESCTFAPDRALTEHDTEIIVTYGSTDLTASIPIFVGNDDVAYAETEAEFRSALADESINAITVTSEFGELTFEDALKFNRSMIVNGDLTLTSLTVDAASVLMVNGCVGGVTSPPSDGLGGEIEPSLTVGGAGKIIINGTESRSALLSGENIVVGGVALTINSHPDFSSVRSSSAIYASGNLTICEGAVVQTHANVYAYGELKLNGGADLTVYGVCGVFDSETVPEGEANMIGNALQSETLLEIEGAQTKLAIYNSSPEVQTETAAISVSSGNGIFVSEATVIIGKTDDTEYFFGYGVWAGVNTTFTNRAQGSIDVYKFGFGASNNSGSYIDIVMDNKDAEGVILPDGIKTTLTVTANAQEDQGALFSLSGNKTRGWVETTVTFNGSAVEEGQYNRNGKV